MSDLEKRMNELCERHSRIPEGPYFVGVDEATDYPPHTNSGLSLVDTGRQSDWPIARLCEGPTADAIADIPAMLTAIREAAAELARLTAELATAKADRNTYDSAHKTEAANVLRLTAEVGRLRANDARYRAGLKYYADMNHAVFNDENAWDTVSGEPANFWCDEAGTATVEDGTVAKLILQGWALPDDPDSEGMIPPEFIDAAIKEVGNG